MFSKLIKKTPFANGRDAIFSKLFPNIIQDMAEANCDVSFISTLRALLFNRLSDDDSVWLEFFYPRASYPTDSINTILPEDSFNKSNLLFVCDLRGVRDSVKESVFENARRIPVERAGWTLLDKVRVFFAKAFRVECYINPTTKSTILLCDSLDLRANHYLQCAIPAFLPWYFPDESSVGELQMNLLKSFRKTTADDYVAAMLALAKEYNIHEKRIRTLLEGVEHIYERREIERVRLELDRYDSQIADINERLRTILETRRANNIRLMGLMASIEQNNGESEIMKYFLCNDALHLDDVNGETITFTVEDDLTFFDEELAKSYINNPKSVFYTERQNNELPPASMRKLMNAIFVDGKIKLRFCAAYRLNLAGAVEGMSGYEFGLRLTDCLPNPHIQQYACLGQNRQAINDCLVHNNYMGAIEQCIASAKSLEVSDAPVMERFTRDFYNRDNYNGDRRFLRLPDGTRANIKEALDYLHKEEAENGEDN
jgi:hypothetical protein